MGEFVIPLLIVVGLFIVILFVGMVVWALKWYRKVEQGTALIINKRKKIDVTFQGGVVIPILWKAEEMDISVKRIEIDRRGENGLICKDNIRADITVAFYMRVNQTEEDVLKVAQMVGCDRASDYKVLEELFSAKFSEALKTVGKKMDFTSLYDNRQVFKEAIIEVIGTELNGYCLEDAAIDYLEQTPKDSLDPTNILDAEGIKKITQLTVEEHIITNDRQRHEEKEVRRQDVEARQTILELDRQEAEAEARQKREVAVIRAREEAESHRVEEEERIKAEGARINADEQLMVQEENKQRQVEIAAKNKERAVAVENERVVRDRDLEATERERLVALKEIEKEKDVETEKKNIQEIIRERVALERTVAEEEEKIKEVRVVQEADRIRQAEVIDAEKIAKKKAIEITVEAEAKETAAKHLYEEQVRLADAEREKQSKLAEGEKARAEGLIAVNAADGMAKVHVEKAEAEAIEVTGKAEASAMREKFNAEADGTKAKGTAEATAKQALYLADAEGIEKKGTAEATANAAKFKADADGINQKAEAMKLFNEAGKEHEEFKLQLQKDERIQLAAIDVNRQIAAEQARVLGEAMKSADIDIVGGDGQFLETFFKSISLAKAVDGFVDNSTLARQLTDGETNLATQVKELIGKEGLKSEDLKNLTISALLAKLALESKSAEVRSKAEDLQGAVEKMGLKDLMAMYLAK